MQRGEVKTRLRNFSGKRNADWIPFIGVFKDLKIPDMEFCLVPGGTFQMGSDDWRYKSEQPVHPQKLKPYWIARYPVTNAQWRVAVTAKAVAEPQGESSLKWYHDKSMTDAPVVGVSWLEVQKFCEWLGVRLPTEPEWEFAARGVDNLRYPWGNDWDENIPVWDKNSGGKPNPVTSKPEGKSWVGAMHLSGNVWEWCSSLYVPYPYDAKKLKVIVIKLVAACCGAVLGGTAIPITFVLPVVTGSDLISMAATGASAACALTKSVYLCPPSVQNPCLHVSGKPINRFSPLMVMQGRMSAPRKECRFSWEDTQWNDTQVVPYDAVGRGGLARQGVCPPPPKLIRFWNNTRVVLGG